MKGSGAGTAVAGRSGVRAISWLVLLAFTLQCFITQTHIHGDFGERAALAATTLGVPAHKNAPAQNRAADCPFCQAIVHAGAFHAPPAQALPLPVFLMAMAAPFFSGARVALAATHLWRSRGPPPL